MTTYAMCMLPHQLLLLALITCLSSLSLRPSDKSHDEKCRVSQERRVGTFLYSRAPMRVWNSVPLNILQHSASQELQRAGLSSREAEEAAAGLTRDDCGAFLNLRSWSIRAAGIIRLGKRIQQENSEQDLEKRYKMHEKHREEYLRTLRCIAKHILLQRGVPGKLTKQFTRRINRDEQHDVPARLTTTVVSDALKYSLEVHASVGTIYVEPRLDPVLHHDAARQTSWFSDAAKSALAKAAAPCATS